MSDYELLRFPSDDALAKHVADRLVTETMRARSTNRPFTVALSGGRIAAKLFSATVSAAREQSLSLGNVEFFWADERCVPPEHPESNFGLANRVLLQPLDIQPARIHRLKGELDEVSAIAAAIADLRGIAPASHSGVPALDLVLLGMGEDGHVASLFPNDPKAVKSDADIYRAVLAVKPPPRRLTLGYRMLTTARAVWVLVSGPGKAEALRESLRPGAKTPLGRVLGSRSSTLVFSDIAAV